jgi:hypothetical protein
MSVAVSRGHVSTGFENALTRPPDGYFEGHFQGQTWGATIQRSADGRRTWLFAEELGGRDVVSFNLYVVSGNRSMLKPCEKSLAKVTEFVTRFSPEGHPRAITPATCGWR